MLPPKDRREAFYHISLAIAVFAVLATIVGLLALAGAGGVYHLASP